MKVYTLTWKLCRTFELKYSHYVRTYLIGLTSNNLSPTSLSFHVNEIWNAIDQILESVGGSPFVRTF